MGGGYYAYVGYGNVPLGRGIDFHDFGIRNGIDFHNFRNWYRVGYAIGKISIKSGIHFGKIGIRNGYVFDTSMARPRPKSGHVPPPPLRGGGIIRIRIRV